MNEIEAKSFGTNLLFQPWKVKNNSVNYFKVLTPFCKSCNLNHNPRSLYSVPGENNAQNPLSEFIDSNIEKYATN